MKKGKENKNSDHFRRNEIILSIILGVLIMAFVAFILFAVFGIS